MMRPERRRRIVSVGSSLVTLIAIAGCQTPGRPASRSTADAQAIAAELQMQDLVMNMADDYIASLSEALHLLSRDGRLNPRARALAQAFLRNGVGASMDIAAGPSPGVSLLDLLVLTSLQAWSFETHWIPMGIGEAGQPAAERLRRAETEAWQHAGIILSQQQLDTVRQLIDAWIADNPERSVVALVRFDDFAESRRANSMSLRGSARGLLREVSEASAAVDDARLLGERVLWYAGRYPYLLGEQVELTMYRLLDQPEGEEAVSTLESISTVSESLARKIDSMQAGIEEQQSAFFERVSMERAAAIEQSRVALDQTLQVAIADAAERVSEERGQAIDQLFDRFADERIAVLEDIASGRPELQGLLRDVRETSDSLTALSAEVTRTMNTLDELVGRFDSDPEDVAEPLRIEEFRSTVQETGVTADKLTQTLLASNELITSDAMGQRIGELSRALQRSVNLAFWRMLVLVLVLLFGFAVIRVLTGRAAPEG